MCNTTKSIHSHEEYDINYISENEVLNVQKEIVPCDHQGVVYVVDDKCNCKNSERDEVKKVSCRSLACQQLNKECDCKKRKKRRKIINVANVLLNDITRVEDKLNNGCASMHENINEIVNNINTLYNELKDEEARAKRHEAFLQKEEDKDVTNVVYNKEARTLEFYHEYPLKCLNVDVKEGCDCECCATCCGCDGCCNTEDCKSDIPYTMNENCEIVPLKRDTVKLFEIDVRDFLRDVFVSNAYVQDDYPDDPDGEKDGPWLVIEYNRWLEKDLEKDSDQSDIEGHVFAGQDENPGKLYINLSKIWKLQNYYDKKETRDQIRRIRIDNLNNPVHADNNHVVVAELVYPGVNGEPDYKQPIKVKIDELINKNATLNFGASGIVLATMGDKQITVNMPSNPAAGLLEQINNLGDTINNVASTIPDVPLCVTDVAADEGGILVTWSDGSTRHIDIAGGSGSGEGSDTDSCLWEVYGDGVIPKNGRVTYSPGFYDTTVS